MASHFHDTSQWRLSTPGGVPYKFLQQNGQFGGEDAAVTWEALILSRDLVAFVTEMLPPPIQIGNMIIQQAKILSGTTLAAKRVRFASFDDNVPIDPFRIDEAASAGTYFPVLKVTVEFGPTPQQNVDPSDPFTFLEISSNASGEFYYGGPPVKWQDEEHPQGADGFFDPQTGNTEPNPKKTGDKRPNRHPLVPSVVTVPVSEWHIRWKQIPFDYFNNVLVHRLRFCLGRVNSKKFPLLFNAYPETLLLDGYNFTEQFTWRALEGVKKPPIDLEMIIKEKRVLHKGLIIGHNHTWEPFVGWSRPLLSDDRGLYEHADLNILFKP